MNADLLKPFPITSLSRQDLLEAGIPRETVLRLDDTTMKAIAAAMEDAYVSLMFEESVQHQVERYLAKQQEGLVAQNAVGETQGEDNPYIIIAEPDVFHELFENHENFVEWCHKDMSEKQLELADRVRARLLEADATHVCVDKQEGL